MGLLGRFRGVKCKYMVMTACVLGFVLLPELHHCRMVDQSDIVDGRY
jgi:hypothetical protein